ncbi:MAG: DUF5666 domain-containing protein [Actinobacteria bacterium]|nr:DUF5666 domain-containing protein [Actinomycetota bacterium]
MKRGLAIGIIVAVAVVVGIGAFFGGKALGGGKPTPQEAMDVLQNLTEEQRAQLFQSGAANGNGGLFIGGNRQNGGNGTTGSGGLTAGTIVSNDGSSLTVKLADGGTKLVLYSPSTEIAVSKSGSASDLTVGQEVAVTGTSNSDGSVTATRIQVGAQLRVQRAPSSQGTASTGQSTAPGSQSTATTAAP